MLILSRVSNLYSLYTTTDSVEKKIINTSDQLNIEESSSKIIENSQEEQLLGQISLSDLEGEAINISDTSDDQSNEKISLTDLEKEG